MFFLKLLLWSPLMLFWKYGRNFFWSGAQNLLPKIRNWQNIPGVFRETKALQLFLWTFRMQFTQCCGKTLVKVMKKNGSQSVNFETCLIVSKLLTPKKSHTLKNAVLTNPLWEFRQKSKRTSLKNPKLIKQKLEQNLKTFTWRHRLQSRKPCQKFSAKNFFPQSKNHRSNSWNCQKT